MQSSLFSTCWELPGPPDSLSGFLLKNSDNLFALLMRLLFLRGWKKNQVLSLLSCSSLSRKSPLSATEGTYCDGLSLQSEPATKPESSESLSHHGLNLQIFPPLLSLIHRQSVVWYGIRHLNFVPFYYFPRFHLDQKLF